MKVVLKIVCVAVGLYSGFVCHCWGVEAISMPSVSSEGLEVTVLTAGLSEVESGVRDALSSGDNAKAGALFSALYCGVVSGEKAPAVNPGNYYGNIPGPSVSTSTKESDGLSGVPGGADSVAEESSDSEDCDVPVHSVYFDAPVGGDEEIEEGVKNKEFFAGLLLLVLGCMLLLLML